MFPFFKAVIIGLLTGILGLIFSFTPVGLGIEENIGLDLLFKIRGEREAPSDVIIVAMDNLSAENLNLPSQSSKWPRSIHARLTEYLTREGAAVIAFDINFSTALTTENDHLFAKAIQNAQNVVLYEYLQKETIILTDEKGVHTKKLNTERLVPPIDLLARSAVALAPFPLPKVPIKVSQYWTFKTSAGDTPTLPVVVFQIFALDVYQKFIQLLAQVNPDQTMELPMDKNDIITKRNAEKLIRTIRNIFMENPSIGKQILEELQYDEALSVSTAKGRLLTSLIKMYQSSDSRFLNFYGPPGTIPTFSYYQVLQQQKQQFINKKQIDFNGKAVFVGYSERLLPSHNDGFHTSFSQPSGVDISGVEMTATAFANLLENMPVQPLSFPVHGVVIFIWGVVLGTVCYLFPTALSALSTIGLSIIYLFYAQYQFKSHGNWYPLITPLFVQSALAFFSTVLWKHSNTIKERQNIRNRLGHYLPNHLADHLVKSIARKETSNQIVYGVCLITDAGQYTRLSEKMTSEELHSLMHEYYKTIFKPVKLNGGIVINIVGDSMLAIWTKPHPDAALRSQACRAALDIANCSHRFNHSIENKQLPTRIGLHYGHISLGNIGALDHYEYRPTGDPVNTASRMEGLNKYLNTEILVSGKVIDQLNGFLTRDLGRFFLAGKSKPVKVYELISCIEKSNDQQKNLCKIFSRALNAYREQSWEKAMNLFSQAIRINKQDGPSLFYLKLIKNLKKFPPMEIWDGCVRMDKK
ncbi:MAG: adenylate/guanylate cyclase domain-containing protein [Thermodesulfobacteriota bacterium]